jgi:hypothetical protein
MAYKIGTNNPDTLVGNSGETNAIIGAAATTRSPAPD